VALAPSDARLFAREFMGVTALMGGTSAKARDLLLPLRIHRSEAAA
jgi:hypothetical protein